MRGGKRPKIELTRSSSSGGENKEKKNGKDNSSASESGSPADGGRHEGVTTGKAKDEKKNGTRGYSESRS